MVISFLVVLFLGLVLGSFSSALAWRVPRGVSWIYDPVARSARSACPSCGMRLGIRDLVPVFSWIFLRGRCRGCGAGISVRYPAIEMVVVFASLVVWFFWGLNINSLLLIFAVPFLVALAVIDFEFFILPDSLVAIVGGLGVLRALWSAFLVQDPAVFAVYIASGGVYALLAFALRAGVGAAMGREAMGLGDVKFFGVAGVWLGMQLLPFFLLASGVFGVIFGLVWHRIRSNPVFPFGPALILGLYGVLIMMTAL